MPDVGRVHDVVEVNDGAPENSFVWLKTDNEKKVLKIKSDKILVVPVRAILIIGSMVLQGFRSLNYL